MLESGYESHNLIQFLTPNDPSLNLKHLIGLGQLNQHKKRHYSLQNRFILSFICNTHCVPFLCFHTSIKKFELKSLDTNVHPIHSDIVQRLNSLMEVNFSSLMNQVFKEIRKLPLSWIITSHLERIEVELWDTQVFELDLTGNRRESRNIHKKRNSKRVRGITVWGLMLSYTVSKRYRGGWGSKSRNIALRNLWMALLWKIQNPLLISGFYQFLS